jgi:hypothetical protein
MTGGGNISGHLRICGNIHTWTRTQRHSTQFLLHLRAAASCKPALRNPETHGGQRPLSYLCMVPAPSTGTSMVTCWLSPSPPFSSSSVPQEADPKKASTHGLVHPCPLDSHWAFPLRHTGRRLEVAGEKDVGTQSSLLGQCVCWREWLSPASSPAPGLPW